MDIFVEIECLTERSKSLKGVDIQKKYLKGADKRIIGQYLHKLVQYNRKAFEFIGINASVEGLDFNASLVFSASNYIGCVPLRASDTGKQIGDLVVKPRYVSQKKYSEYLEILHLIGNDISPEFLDGLSLRSGNTLQPPRYLEAIKFIDLFYDVSRSPWRKFDVVEKLASSPSGHVNWNKYAKQSGNPNQAILYPQHKNILSEHHAEYAHLNYVFQICRSLILNSNLTFKLQKTVAKKIEMLAHKLLDFPVMSTNKIAIRQSDKALIQACKKQANRVLANQNEDYVGWRLDVAQIFERYVQFIFKDVAKITGGSLFKNYRLPSKDTKQVSWQLQHLEPDAIYQRDGLVVFIDAKYKSHFYNSHSDSAGLKEEHRRDIHQILAYTSFSAGLNKYAILCYPAEYFHSKSVIYQNPLNTSTNQVILVGLPMDINFYNQSKQSLVDILMQFTGKSQLS